MKKIITTILLLSSIFPAFSTENPQCEYDKTRSLLLEKEKQLDFREKQLEAEFIRKKGLLELEYTKKMAFADADISFKKVAADKEIRDRLKALEKELQRREDSFYRQHEILDTKGQIAKQQALKQQKNTQ